MFKRYRAFAQDFRSHMDRHSAWPSYKDARHWFEMHAGGLKNDSYSQLKAGVGVPEKYSLGVIRMLLEASAPQDYSRQSLGSFLSARGLATPPLDQLDSVLAAVCDPATAAPTPAEDGREDGLAKGFVALWPIITRSVSLDRGVQSCAGEADVREAVHWMFIDFGRQWTGNPRLGLAEAVHVACAQQRISLEDYQDRATAWWKFNPWTVVLTRGKARPVGMSIVLPLKLRAYNAILTGSRNSYETGAEDLEPMSPLILIEAVGPRPAELAGEAGNATMSMFLSLSAQVGALSRCDRLSEHEPLRMLSFAALPVTRTRLLAQGFEPTGTLMANSDMEVFEIRLRNSGHNPREFLSRALLNQFSKSLDSPPPPPADYPRTKRR